jgi:hypothetical protein
MWGLSVIRGSLERRAVAWRRAGEAKVAEVELEILERVVEAGAHCPEISLWRAPFG